MRAGLGALSLALLAPAWSFAGRPLTTEDASVLDDKACQVEAWIDRSRESTTGWLVPACNFGLGIEWQAGFARRHAQGESAFSDAYFQGKAVWRTADEGPFGLGIVVGVLKHALQEANNGWENPFVLVPLSFHPGGDAGTLVHLNAGWGRNRQEGRNLTLWGAAIESALNARVTLLAEAFGENASRPFVRVGSRINAIKDQLDFDLTYVARAGGTRDERFISLGLYWQTSRFLP